MTARQLTPELRLWMLRCIGGLVTLAQWWRNELLATVPGGLANWLVDGGARRLVLAAAEGAVAFHLMNDGGRVLAAARVDQSGYAPDVIDAFLETNRCDRKDVAIGLRMPADSVFYRKLLLPLEVQRSLNNVVVQDMTAKTPFQIDDVFHAYASSRMGGTLEVRQWIVRRKHVDAALGLLGIEISDLAFIEADSEIGNPPALPALELHNDASRRQHWIKWTAASLAATALVLACLAGGLRYSHQEELLQSLATELVAERTKAQQILRTVADAEREAAGLDRVRMKRNLEPGLLDVWEEATRVLPNDSWLTELRFSESGDARQVVLTGYARAAAALVPLVDRSALFRDASLVAPISLDQGEDRERFTIQATLAKDEKRRTASK